MLSLVDPSSSAMVLIASAFLIGVTHTLLGPDHYLPFVALGRARRWSRRRTLGVALLCGMAHLAASLLIGIVGSAAGWSLTRLEWIEHIRGDIAAWILVGFGLLYLVWALKNRQKPHSHLHVHSDGTVHNHLHGHRGAHAHPHFEENGKSSLAAWGLFVFFIFGPCEVLIPLLLFPAMEANLALAAGVVIVFALSTLTTMLAMVWLLTAGVERWKPGKWAPNAHVAAGLILTGCGIAIHLGH